jgi:diacylglycerol kinase (ATP)
MVKLKVLFVINQKAGQQSNHKIHEIIIKHAKKYDYEVNFYEMGTNHHAAEIHKSIDLFKPDIVGAVGGDGTVNLVSTIIQKTNISLLIIPYGSANGMAKELQIPENLPACLDLIIRGKTVEIDLLKVNNEISIHLADVGLNASIVKRFQLDKKRGLLTYGKHLFAEIFIIKRKRFTVFYDDQTKKVNAVSLTFANATMYGTGAVINPDGKLNDGMFEICIVKPFPKYLVFNIAYQMFRNKLKTSKYFEVIKCTTAKVICKRKTLLQVDGEVLGKVKEIELTCLTKVLKVIISADLNHPTIVN